MSLFGWLFGWDAADARNGAAAPGADAAGFNEDDYQNLALDTLWGKITHSIPPYDSDATAKNTIQTASDLRQQYAALQPKRLRDHVMKWLDWYEKEARRCIYDNAEGTLAARTKAWDDKQYNKKARIQALRSAIEQHVAELPPQPRTPP